MFAKCYNTNGRCFALCHLLLSLLLLLAKVKRVLLQVCSFLNVLSLAVSFLVSERSGVNTTV